MGETTGPSRKAIVEAVVLAWLFVVGVDFFLNAGLLARVWEEESPFLLPAVDMFVRIPLGYAAFLLWAILVVWLILRVGIRQPLAGAVFAAEVGVLVAVATTLALVSISTVSATVAVAWTATQVAEFAGLGYIGTLALRPDRPERMPLWIVGLTLALVAAGVITQNVL